MNELSEIDKALLESLKSKIEQLAGLPGQSDLSQKDFDFLVFYVQEKTGQALSLTTLKRIWRNEYQRLPHLSTLNMLAQIACNLDWHTAKKQFLENQPADYRFITDTPAIHTKPMRGKLVLPFSVATVVITVFLWYYLVKRPADDIANIQFSAEVTADRIIPNSVVFSYDLHTFKAEHFYIQQSWDPSKIVEISPANKKQTDIYYEPGYHYAKLLGNEKVLKEIPVHIKYNDWYVRFRYPNGELVAVSRDDLHTSGYLGLTNDYIGRLQLLDRKFQLGYMLSKDFDAKADEFQLAGMIKFDSVNAPPCPMLNILIKGDNDYSWITFGNVGCESNVGIKVSDRHVNGKTNDLSTLRIDAFSWQKFHIKLSKGTCTLSINDTAVHTCTYSKPLGNLKEIDLFFNGIGSISDVKFGDSNGLPMITAN